MGMKKRQVYQERLKLNLVWFLEALGLRDGLIVFGDSGIMILLAAIISSC